MKKVFVLTALVLALSLPAAADLVNGDWSTGDETGWTRWWAPWGASNYGVTFNGPFAPEGTAWLDQGQQGSFGWYQVVECPAGMLCCIQGMWAGDIDGLGWAEVMFWTTNDPNENHGNRADVGNSADIAFKKDSWGMNPPTAWDWESIAKSPHPQGNGGMLISQGYVVVGLKVGSVSGNPVWASWDNLCLYCVPEPGSLLALATGLVGLAGFAVRRRR